MKAHEQDVYTERESSKSAALNEEAMAVLAYFYWEARGCPSDSPDEDWFRAEAEVRNRLAAAATA